MPLYDFLAPAYDPAFEKIHLPFGRRALATLSRLEGGTVLDLACGTGQNFPMIAELIGPRGHLIGLDLSAGMLRRARGRTRGAARHPQVTLIQGQAALLTAEQLAAESGVTQVDSIVCSYGFTSMRDPESAFGAAWKILRPGGSFLVLDIHAEPRTLHARAVELLTHSRFSEEAWEPLRRASTDFRMDYLDPSAHLFGGRLFVAWGTKPPANLPSMSCPS